MYLFSWVVDFLKQSSHVYETEVPGTNILVEASNALKSACDIVFAGLSAGGPFQGTAIKTPAGRPCGLVGVSEFLEP